MNIKKRVFIIGYYYKHKRYCMQVCMYFLNIYDIILIGDDIIILLS